MASNPPKAAQPMLWNPASSPTTRGVQRATAARRPRSQSIWRSNAAALDSRREESVPVGVIGRASNEESMPEMPNAGEDHCQAESVGSGDYVFILYGPAGLNHCSCSRVRHSFKAVGEGKERVGGSDGALERQHSLLRAEARGVDAAHLACAHSDCLAIARIDDCIRFDVL